MSPRKGSLPKKERALFICRGSGQKRAPMKRVLLLKPGVASSRALLGDYEVWFGRRCPGAALTPVELHAGEAPPSLVGVDAVIMSGSPLSVTRPTEWMARAADALLEAGARGLPVLGVCFGHQLLAWRLGAAVRQNPKGRELGTVPVHLTPEGRRDALFAGVPARFEVQATHEDEVAALPREATLLATNETSAVQAYRVGATTWAVQFHPEMDEASIRFCVEAKETSPEDAARAAVRETPWGAQLLRNFMRLV